MSDFELLSCFSKYKKNFLVSATIHKARNLNVLNADTFVVVSFNEEIKRTKIFQNSDCPFFNEVNLICSFVSKRFSKILVLIFSILFLKYLQVWRTC